MTGLALPSFDTLLIAGRLNQAYVGLSLSDVQAVSYLACLLSVYGGAPASAWGYSYVSAGASPFSPDLLSSVEALTAVGELAARDQDTYEITERGRRSIERLARLEIYRPRIAPLSGAIEAALALPLPSIQNGLAREPQLARANAYDLPSSLLNEMGLSALHGDFSTLEGELGRGVDLIVPAVVWMSFLLKDIQSPAASLMNPGGGS